MLGISLLFLAVLPLDLEVVRQRQLATDFVQRLSVYRNLSRRQFERGDQHASMETDTAQGLPSSSVARELPAQVLPHWDQGEAHQRIVF